VLFRSVWVVWDVVDGGVCCGWFPVDVYFYTNYIRNNNPTSAYALHILQNRHEYGQINETMTLLHPEHRRTRLLLYEQYYMHAQHKNNKIIPEQIINTHINPLLQLIHNHSNANGNWKLTTTINTCNIHTNVTTKWNIFQDLSSLQPPAIRITYPTAHYPLHIPP
jgi:phage antirepressor YoqD-like protein